MIHSVDEAEAYLNNLPFVSRGDFISRLELIKSALNKLGNPQNSIPAIHVAGTSGKGSTAYYVANLLSKTGYKVGFSVSPHLNKVTERTQVLNKDFSDQQYCRYFNDFLAELKILKLDLSYIEFTVIFAYWVFAKLKLDYIVIEVGLGGRLDSTNTITRHGTLRLITDIGYDHMDILGHTLPEIASEKAGIIHVSDTVVMHRQSSEIMAVIQKKVKADGAHLEVLENDRLKDSKLVKFQQRNLTLAIRAVNIVLRRSHKSPLTEKQIKEVQAIKIPGRFEELKYKGVDILLDVAHNSQKLKTLSDSLMDKYPNRNYVLVIALSSSKVDNISVGLISITSSASYVIATSFSSEVSEYKKMVDPKVLESLILRPGLEKRFVESIKDPYKALDKAINIANQENSLLVITGSFFVVNGLRSMLFCDTK